MKVINKLKKLMRVYGVPPRMLPTIPLLGQPIEGVMNPAFVPAAAPDDLHIVCRKHYYDVDWRGMMIGEPSIEKTQNLLFRHVLSRRAGDLAEARLLPVLDGLEDTRFYEHGERVFWVASRIVPSAEKRTAIVLGSCAASSFEDGRDDFTTAAVEGPLSRIEKNWVYFDHGGRLFVERLPGMRDVYVFDAAENKFRSAGVTQHHDVWSGTKSIRWNGGNLFLDHKRVHILKGAGTLVRFAYRFRFHANREAQPVTSAEFSLAKPDAGLVYASDMHLVEDELLIGIGIDDARSQILRVPVAEAARRLGL